MKKNLTSLFLVAAVAFFPSAVRAQSQTRSERIEASFLLALGRVPSTDELAAWSKPDGASVSELVARHRTKLESDAGMLRATVIRACIDGLGRLPTEAETSAWANGHRTYTEQVQQHIRWLAEHPADYAAVVDRAYQRVIHRSVYPGEIEYWKKRSTLSYVLLVGCIEDWGRRNAPGLMETTGTATVSVNCRFLSTIPVSPEVAIEARAAVAPIDPDAIPLETAAGHNLVAAGAERIVTAGRMHLVAAGSPDLLPASSGL